MAGERPLAHVTAPVVAVVDRLPEWVRLVRAPNPGPMTLEGTNTWVLRSAPDAPAVVVDPGPDDEGHLRAAAGAAQAVECILVTHGHPDHVAGLARFQELTGAAVLPVTSPAERAGLRITPVPTPGHTSDSVCYLVERGDERVMLTGDTILGRGTTVVAWPDGDLGDYLTSLERLTGFPGVPALPGHGPALTDCAAAAAWYLQHRKARLDLVARAVAEGATTPAEVVTRAYPDLDPSLREAAEWSVRAQLAYLERVGIAPPASQPPRTPGVTARDDATPPASRPSRTSGVVDPP